MDEFKVVEAEEASGMIEKGEAAVVDIRQKEDFSQSHIKGARWVGDENIQHFLNNANKDVPLICYCYHGFSSQQAAQFFKSSGFKEVYSLEGGFENWRLSYPFEEGS